MKKVFASLMFATLGMLTLLSSADAGGWAVITLDQVPYQVVVDQPLAVTFTIRQHGTTMWDYDHVLVRYLQTATNGGTFTPATKLGSPGRYTVTLAFNHTGRWNWAIASGLAPQWQPMPDLTVVSSASASTDSSLLPSATDTATDLDARVMIPLIVGLIGMMGLGGVFVLYRRARNGYALPALVLAGMLSAGGLSVAADRAWNTPLPVANQVAETIQTREAAQRLFVAKGCIVCHNHDQVADTRAKMDFAMTEFPDLTNRGLTFEYLRRWLHDPAAIRPETYMPNLNLSDQEIETLATWLAAGPQVNK